MDLVKSHCSARAGDQEKKAGSIFMKRITTFAAFAVFALVVGTAFAIADQSNGTGPGRLKTPRGQAPASLVKQSKNRDNVLQALSIWRNGPRGVPA